MSEIALQLLATFDSLPAKEQHELLVLMIQRNIGMEIPVSGHDALDSEQLAKVADEMFQILDDEEADGGRAQSR